MGFVATIAPLVSGAVATAPALRAAVAITGAAEILTPPAETDVRVAGVVVVAAVVVVADLVTAGPATLNRDAGSFGVSADPTAGSAELPLAELKPLRSNSIVGREKGSRRNADLFTPLTAPGARSAADGCDGATRGTVTGAISASASAGIAK